MPDINLEQFSHWLGAHPGWILLSLALVAFIESLAIAGIVVPGVAMLFSVAVVAGTVQLDLLSVLTAAFVGAVAGDVLSFYIGRHFKDSLPRLWPVSRYPQAMLSGQRFFAEHGSLSVVIGRFVGPVRPVLPMIAGMMGMSQIRFISVNLLSALAWAPAYILPGYLVGAAIDIDFPKNTAYLIAALLIAVAGGSWLFRFASQRLQEGENWYDALSQAGLFGSPERKEKPIASLILLCFSVLAFVVWSIGRVHSDALAAMDQLWLALALSLDFDGLRQTLVVITMLGDEHFLQFSFAALVVMLMTRKHMHHAILLALAGIATSIITHTLKLQFAIPRPDIFVAGLSSLAYPSGHSSGTMVLYGLFASLIASQLSNAARWRVYLVAFTLPFLVALSRVLLGVHWFSDVIGGLLLGLAICSLGRIILWLSRGKDMANEAPLTKAWQLACVALLLLSYGIYCYISLDNALTLYALR